MQFICEELGEGLISDGVVTSEASVETPGIKPGGPLDLVAENRMIMQKRHQKIKNKKPRIHLTNMEHVPIACLTDIVVKTMPTIHEKVRFNRARTSLLLPSSLSFVSERLSN